VEGNSVYYDECFSFFMTLSNERLQKCEELIMVQVITDPWCSCGGLTPDGTLLVAGGWNDGAKTSRYYGGHGQKNCKNCDWREYPGKFQEERWYVLI